MSEHIKIDTIEQAIQVLAYNEQWWVGFAPHQKDIATIKSLADNPYAYTEKQGKLAVAMLKRYHTLFQKFGVDLTELLNKPVYREPFRTIDYEKSIQYHEDQNGKWLTFKFPYNKKIIELVRCLKHQKTMSLSHMTYDGDSKKWVCESNEINLYYLMLIAIRYDFKILNPELLDRFDEIKKIKLSIKKPVALIDADKVRFKNIKESLIEWWQENVATQSRIRQIDRLKELAIDRAPTDFVPKTLTEKIAFSMSQNIQVDRDQYTKSELIKSLLDLDSLPAMVQIGHEISQYKHVEEIQKWLDAFYKMGIRQSQIAWGFTLDDPPHWRKQNNEEQDNFYSSIWESAYPSEKPDSEKEDMYENWCQLQIDSKAQKRIDDNTKIIFVGTKIPRAFSKSGIQLKSTFTLYDGGYWPGGTETLTKLVDNLPKRVYYVTKKESTFASNIKNNEFV